MEAVAHMLQRSKARAGGGGARPGPGCEVRWDVCPCSTTVVLNCQLRLVYTRLPCQKLVAAVAFAAELVATLAASSPGCSRSRGQGRRSQCKACQLALGQAIPIAPFRSNHNISTALQLLSLGCCPALLADSEFLEKAQFRLPWRLADAGARSPTKLDLDDAPSGRKPCEEIGVGWEWAGYYLLSTCYCCPRPRYGQIGNAWGIWIDETTHMLRS